MLDNKNNQNNNKSAPNFLGRNDLENPALLEAEEKIMYVNHNIKPASDDFRETLKAKILEQRHKKFNMNAFASLFTFRRVTSVISVLVLVALVITTIRFWPSGQGGVGQLARLIINPAYAADNFEIQAVGADALGIDTKTQFILKSKESLKVNDLKKYITLSPAVDFDVEEISNNEFKITPKTDLQSKKVYNVAVAAAYIADNGLPVNRDFSWAFQVRDQFKVKNILPGNHSYGVPLNTGIEITFSHENFINYEKSFSIEPSVEGKFEKHKNTLVFVPKELKKGQIYTVKISKDLELENSTMRLKDDYVFQFETDPGGMTRDFHSFGFRDDFSTFSTKQTQYFEIYQYNIDQADKYNVIIYSFKSTDQFISALKDKLQVPSWADYNRVSTLYKTEDLNKVTQADLQLTTYGYSQYLVLPEALPTGYYLVEAKVNDMIRQVYFQVSDLSVYSSVTKTDTLIWLNDLVTGDVAKNAEIKVVDKNIVKNTNDHGVVLIPTMDLSKKVDDYDNASFILQIKGDNKEGIFLMGDNYFNSAEKDNYWRYFYTDRPMYLPNDSIKFWGFVKTRDKSALNRELKITLSSDSFYDYYSDPVVISETKATIDDTGSYQGQLVLENINPGYYYLKVMSGEEVINTSYVEVQTYTKPAYTISVEPEKRAIWAGDDIKTNLTTKFYEGTPVSNMNLTVTTQLLGNKEIKTNQDGTATANYKSEYQDCKDSEYGCDYPKYYDMSVAPTKAEEGEITGQNYVMAYGANVSLRVDFESINKTEANIKVKTTKVDLDKINSTDGYDYYDNKAEPAPNVPLDAEIVEISYDKKETGQYYDFINKKVVKTFTYNRVEKPYSSYKAITDDSGQSEYRLSKLDPEKSYFVRVLATDNRGRHDKRVSYLYSSRGYEFGGNSQDYFSLILKNIPNDFSGYGTGDKVQLSFERNGEALPGSNKEQYLYYKLQQGLIGYDLGKTADYQFNFAESDIPNVFIKGVWFDGAIYHESDYSGNGWWGSGTSVYFNSHLKELKINVATDKDQYVPGQEANLSVKVTDQNGKPVSANVNLNLVDEAYYSLREDYANALGSLYNTVDAGIIITYRSHKEAVPMMGAEGGGCFLAGTKIRLADGSEKNIEDIVANDMITTFADPMIHSKEPARVLQKFEHIVAEYLIINNKLRVTPVHRMFINNGWQMIGEAKVGDYLLDESGNKVKIESIERVNKNVKVYNLHIENYHTYFADGFYVHNDKGGSRQNFADVALFTSVKTDSSGQARVKVTLPDNITTWRVTTQAISPDLFAGQNISKIKVTLPVFIQTTFAKQYLLADKPTIKIRTYGTGLITGDYVNYIVDAPDFGLNQSKISGKAYEPEYVSLNNLSEGNHKIQVSAEAKAGKDSIINSVDVIKSRLIAGIRKFYKLTPDLQIEGSKDGLTTLVFHDENRGAMYSELSWLSYSYGDRVDQRLSRVVGKDLLNKYFAEDIPADNGDDNLSLYQQGDGGISLLPYSSSDLELSAKVAGVAAKDFDSLTLGGYFYKVLRNTDSNQDEIIQALYGLSALHEPVLLQIQNFAQLTDLTVSDQLYIAIAADRIGDKELARKLFTEIMNKNSEKMDPYIKLKVGKDNDDEFNATALAAILAADLNDARHHALWQYVKEKNTKDILLNLQELAYIQGVLPQLSVGDVSFTVQYGNQNINKTLKKGDSFKLTVTASDLANIKFSNIVGNVSVTSTFNSPVQDLGKQNNDISISRKYFVGDKETTNFKEDDLVQVRIYPKFGKTVLDGNYQVTDFIPSGLIIVTNPYSRGQYSNDCGFYPYEINGQVAKFNIYSRADNINFCYNADYFSYYMRVVNPGEYLAESVFMQSMKSFDVRNYSSATTVKIDK